MFSNEIAGKAVAIAATYAHSTRVSVDLGVGAASRKLGSHYPLLHPMVRARCGDGRDIARR
jgi:hypothetical protein